MNGESIAVKNSFNQPDVTGDNALELNGSVIVNGKDVTVDMTFKKLIGVRLADINAGKVIIDGVAGKQIVVVDFSATIDGNFAATTSVDIKDESAVSVASMGVAGLVANAVLRPGMANVTKGAGFQASLTVDKGLKIVNKGNAGTTATGIIFAIEYALV